MGQTGEEAREELPARSGELRRPWLTAQTWVFVCGGAAQGLETDLDKGVRKSARRGKRNCIQQETGSAMGLRHGGTHRGGAGCGQELV